MSSWYFNKNLKPQGPVSFDEVKRKIQRGEIGPQDLLAKEGENSWLPALEWREFPREFFPAFQTNYFKSTDPDEKEWIVLAFNLQNPEGVQQGPYSIHDVNELLSQRLLSPEDYIWKTGLSGWVQIKDRADFQMPVISPDL